MSFWTDSQLKEPLRQYRWFIEFGNPELAGYRFALKDCKKPSYKVETTQHVLINHTYNFPKTLVWQPIDFTFVSARNNASNEGLARVLVDMASVSGYLTPRQTVYTQALAENNNPALLNRIDSISKISSENVLGFLEIVQVDSNGYPIEVWHVFGSMITGVDFGTLSYEQEGFVDIKISLSYDYAELIPLTVGTYDSEKYITTAINYYDLNADRINYVGTPGFIQSATPYPQYRNPNRINSVTPAVSSPSNTTKTG